jgi:hypothetical protein
MLPWTCPHSATDLIGKKVKGSLWGYVPDCTGEDVDKDFIGEFIGTVEAVCDYNPDRLRIKRELFQDNVKDAPWTPDFSRARTCMGEPNNMEGEYIEEWFYNLSIVS